MGVGTWSQIIIAIFDKRQQLVKDMVSIAEDGTKHSSISSLT